MIWLIIRIKWMTNEPGGGGGGGTAVAGADEPSADDPDAAGPPPPPPCTSELMRSVDGVFGIDAASTIDAHHARSSLLQPFTN